MKSKTGKNQQKMTNKERIEGSKFRIINEKLYTATSEESQKLFRNNPEYFNIMHRGFINQASTWPIVPVDEVIRYLKKTCKASDVIADMGCGDAKIAQSLDNTVHSFDFKARNQNVVECDMAHVPLSDSSVDTVTFVLSLMGTNLGDFIKEANRILKTAGTLLIVEVTSRIPNLGEFIASISSYGFQRKNSKPLTDYFTWIELVKVSDVISPVSIELNPCIYKRR